MAPANLTPLPAIPANAAISVVAPASFARQDRVDGGVKALRAAGFVPRFVENALARGPLFFAGTTEERIADLHAAFADPDTQIVMALRGGYGSNYLLDKLDLDLIRRCPKPFFA